MIQIARTNDDRIVIASNQVFPSQVRRVEYFRDLKLLMLVFQNEEDGSDLMPCEISDDTSTYITQNSSFIFMPIVTGQEYTMGYDVPLVQIGL
jgi:hypothetical protein